MTNTLNDRIWLTPAARDQLSAERDKLTRLPAPNSETEARIRELHALLGRAESGAKPDDGLVEPGMTITVRFDDDRSETTFLLGPREIAESDPTVVIDIYPPSSPLGAAIVGLYPGDRFHYAAPSGAEIGGCILAAVPFRGLS